MPVTILSTDSPSRSKGWARYQVLDSTGKPALRSSTGNEFLSPTTKARQVEATAEEELLTVRMQVMLNVGSGMRRRSTIATEAVTLRVRDGARCTLRHYPGSQGLALSIEGAEVAL